MKPIEFFKLQAKNLFKDYKTKTPHTDEVEGYSYYKYDPKFFDIDGVFMYYLVDEENFSLMKAQHIIATMVGFNKWVDLLKASDIELQLAKAIFDNLDKVSLDDWEMYIHGVERDLPPDTLDPEMRLEIFTEVYVNVAEHNHAFGDFRLSKD